MSELLVHIITLFLAYLKFLFAKYYYVAVSFFPFQFLSLFLYGALLKSFREAANKFFFFSYPATKASPLELSDHICFGFFSELQKK